ncbi:MAG TPA: oligosaccharide flippase family protein, partial [Tenericutes bacterium]|nr:oligosaccharide flippase family protein [Mycoplasmatota bacterium]
QAILFSLIIGVPCTILFIIKPDILLKFLYNTDKGILYTRILAPICLIYYIQAPLTATLQAIGKSKCAMKGTLFGMIIRTSLLFVLSYLKIGMWPLIIATSVNIIYITLHHAKYVKKYLN